MTPRRRKKTQLGIARTSGLGGDTQSLASGGMADQLIAEYWTGRRADEARLGRAMHELGATEESRVRWFLEFTRRSLKRLDDEAWSILHSQLRYLAPHHPAEQFEILPWPPSVPNKRERRQIGRYQRALRECLTNLAQGKKYECHVPAGQRVFSPPARRQNRRTPVRIATFFFVGGPAALVHAAVDMLDHVGADRLKLCPFSGSPKEPGACGRLFLADHRNQDFCEERHAKKTAWLKWWRVTKGGTRAQTAAATVPATVPAATKFRPLSGQRQPMTKTKTLRQVANLPKGR